MATLTRRTVRPTTPKPPVTLVEGELLSDDGVWAFIHEEDAGTRWHIVHRPSARMLLMSFRNKTAALHYVGSGRVLDQLADEALLELTRPEYSPGMISNHDLARGVLTWVAEYSPSTLRLG